MPMFKTSDGSGIFYKDWGDGPPVVFSHGWPLSADAWDAQLLFFGKRGYRVVAHDRRGHGRSDQTWHGNDMDRYADDLAELIDALDLRDVVLVGHSTGGGEVTRYVGRYGTERVARIVLLAAVPPLLRQTGTNPEGVPYEVFEDLRAKVARNRAQLWLEFAEAFYGFNRPGAERSQGLVDAFWRQAMQGSIVAVHDCIAQFSETDFTDDLRRIDVPTLFVHGDDDQVVPIGVTSLKAAKLVKNATVKIHPNGSHGWASVQPDHFNRILLEFVEAGAPGRAAATEQAPATVH